MGCCFSKNDGSHQNPTHPLVSDSQASFVKPPLPQLEEETVKEVLSETPSLKKPSSTYNSFQKINEEKQEKLHKVPFPSTLPSFPKLVEEEPLHEEKKERKKIDKETPFIVTQQQQQEISEEISEICSFSESYSTTTVTERKEEEDYDDDRSYGEVRQRVDRSPAKVPRRRSNPPGEFAGIPDRGHKSPARRSEPSPGRRNDNAVRSLYSTDVGQNGRRRIYGNNSNHRSWRDPGECSGRRSRSPSTTRTDSGPARPGLGRSPSSRKTGRSPARGPPLVTENDRRLEEAKEEENRATNESLENPLVSLECFIFL